jgi:hypothetical protein
MKIERKVLKLFGLIIKPANWTIFLSGLFLIPVGVASIWWELSTPVIGGVLIALQGVDFLVSGYGEVKDDEDLPKS